MQWWSVPVAILASAALAVSVSPVDADGSAPSGLDSLSRLKAGNAQFVSNPEDAVSIAPGRRSALAQGQAPFATILSCADSRVPPEIVFHAGLGELFVVRAAGNVTDHAILASVEYAAEHLHTPLVVVMGHESCGAVKAAAEAKGPSESANLEFLLRAIQAARRQVATAEDRDDREDIKALVLANVEEVINDAMAKSPVLRKLVAAGTLEVVGGYYELVSGRVMFSDPVPPPPAAPAARK